jgi:hypothetical protein
MSARQGLQWSAAPDVGVLRTSQWSGATLGERKVNRGCQMRESQVAEKLTMRWVEVTGADGRVRLEMRWSVPGTPLAPTSPHHHDTPVHAA